MSTSVETLTSTLALSADGAAAMMTTPNPTSCGDAEMIKLGSEKSLVEELNFVMSAIVGPIFCVIGMVGNVLSIVTWNRPKMRSSTGRYLTGQAVADFAVLLFFLLVDSTQYWNPDVVYSLAYGVFFSYIGYPGLFLAVVCSVWYTVGVTCDRYIMVCWLTKAKRLCSEKRANLGLFLITFNSFIINFPHYFSYAPVYTADGSGNNNNTATTAYQTNDGSSSVNGSTINSTTNGCDEATQNEAGAAVAAEVRVKRFEATIFTQGPSGQFYEFWIHCMFLIIIPWVIVFVMNIMIIRTVRQSNKKNADKKTFQSAKNSKDSETQITRLLLSVTFTFLFFIGLQCVIQCMFMRKPSGANMFLVNSSFAFAKCGIIFNSSLNFFLYCLTGRRFRVELLKVLGLRERDSQLSSLMDRPSTSSSSRKTTSTTGTSAM